MIVGKSIPIKRQIKKRVITLLGALDLEKCPILPSDKLIESKLTYIIFWMHPYYCTYVHNTVKGVSKMNICNLIYGFMESN